MFDEEPREYVAERASLLLEALPLGVALIGRSGEVRVCNERFRAAVEGTSRGVEAGLAALRPVWGLPGGVLAGGKTFRLGVRPLAGGALLVTLEEVEPRGVEGEGAPRAPRAEFLSVAAHDLRGALANVRSFAELMLSARIGLEGRARRAAEAVARNADRALELSRDVFDSLRHELGAMPIQLEPEDVSAQLARALEPARELAASQSVRLEEDLAEGLPQVLADAERLRHAVGVLLRQAIARAERGGRTVRVLARAVAGYAFLAILDDGPPQPLGELALLLDRDASVAAEHRLGEGFRLCLARAELEAQGAAVTFSQDKERGVSFLLPSVRPTEH